MSDASPKPGETKRDPRWRQENPRDQARVLVGAIEGHLSNANGGIAVEKSIDGALERIQDLKALLKAMPEGRWHDGGAF